MKIKSQNKIKNFILSFVIAIAMLLCSNTALLFGVANGIRSLASAEYKPSEHQAYDFSATETGWSKTTNAPSKSALETAFNTSKYNVNLYDNTYSLKPSTLYDGTSLTLEEGETKQEYAMSIQANEAPKKVTVDKTDKDGNIVYEKDADGNFIFVPKVYTAEDAAGNGDLYEYKENYHGFTGYLKRIEITKDGVTDYKKDSDDNFIYEAEQFSSNSSNADAGIKSEYYIKIDGTDQYNRRIPIRVEEDSYFGYKTSSTLPSLGQDSWYVFSFWAWTKDTDATMVLYSGKKVIKTITIENKGTDEWTQYFLFFESISDTNTDGISTAFNIAFFLGGEKSIAGEDTTKDTVTGAVFIDKVLVQKISETDYRNGVITGTEFPENHEVDWHSLRYDLTLSGLNADFQNDITVEEKMYNEDGYMALADGDAAYQYEKYVSRYTSDAGTEDRSENALAEIRDTYNQKFGWSIVSEETEIEEEEKDEDGETVKDEEGNVVKNHFNTFNPENKILKLENKSERFDLGLLSANITVQQFRTYRLTIYLKGTTADDSAYVKLISKIKTGQSGDKGSPIVKSQKITPYTDNSDFTNNWTEVTFYIQGNCFYNTTFQIAILACANSTIYADNIRLESISSKIYRDQASAKKFDLAPTSSYPSSRIENGNFNSILTNESDPDNFEIPYNPYGWSKLTDSSESVVAGIVSTNDTFFTQMRVKKNSDSEEMVTIQQKLGNPNVPITTKTYLGEPIVMPRDNVLAIYSPSKDNLTDEEKNALPKDWKGHYFGYKSSSYNFSSNNVYLLTFDVYVAGVNDAAFSDDGKVFANLIYEDNHVSEITLDNSVTDEWQTYTFVIRTGSVSRSMYLELGVKDATGTVFFQKVNIKQLEEKDNPDDKDDKITINEQYAEKFEQSPSIKEQNDNKVRFVDFDGDVSVMASQEKVEGKPYYSSLSHSLKEADDDEELVQGEFGILDTYNDPSTTDDDSVKLSDTLTLTKDQLAAPSAVKSKNVMMIYNSTDYSTTVYPNKNSTLTSSSYYEITLWVKTIGVPEGKGLTITMDSISVGFKNVNTEHGDFVGEQDNNGYTKFTALVKTGTSSYSGFRISFMLGEEENETSGVALIAGMSLNKVSSEDDYNELVEAVDENDKTTVVKDFVVPDTTSTADEDADNLTLATFFLVFSSILLVGAIIFAIVAVYIKKAPKKAKSKTTDENDTTPKEGFV